jgi:hypothetical protein
MSKNITLKINFAPLLKLFSRKARIRIFQKYYEILYNFKKNENTKN